MCEGREEGREEGRALGEDKKKKKPYMQTFEPVCF